MKGQNDYLLLLLSFFLLFFLPLSLAQSSGYNCSADRSIYPCQAYALYRVGLDPGGPRDLASVGDLFGVSRLMVARASNLSASAPLRTGQPLLIPLACSCDARTNRSYFPIAYQIVAGDTYYDVSTYKFDNLTAYPAVIIVNPTLVPTDLQIGNIVTFPLFCQCPNASIGTGTTTGANASLVTYVVQPSDTYSSIASSFGATVQSLISLNGPESQVQPFTTILVRLAQDPPPILLSTNSSSAPPAPPPSPPPPPPIIVRKERKGVVVGLAIGLGLMGVLWVAALSVILGFRRRFARVDRRRPGEEDGKGSSGGWPREGGKGGGGGGEKRLMRRWESDDEKLMDISEWLDKYKVYQMEELRQATADFDRSHLIQGSVYKGSIDGEVVAIKKMKWNARDELKILQKVNHSNLVKLEGFCIDSDSGTCYLVYEYVENGSLSSWLRDRDAARKLDWRARLRIALDIAHGLQYIHEHTWPRVVHKDIKSSNVLLDANLRAKIANFGLAKSGCNAVTTHIVGTQGYIAPEYLSDGLVTTKMDVFAYGVVLLELVLGKEAVSDEGEMLWVEVEAVFGGDHMDAGMMEGRIREWMDPALREQSFLVESVVSVMSIARACLEKDPSKRPSMVDVAYTLSKAEEVYGEVYGDGLSVGNADVMGR